MGLVILIKSQANFKPLCYIHGAREEAAGIIAMKSTPEARHIAQVIDNLALSYAPYSKFCVSAVLVCDGGEKIFRGCNVENASYGLTVCAERVAIFNAVSAGQLDFDFMLVASQARDYCWPCGACRQVISEFAPDIDIYSVRLDGSFEKANLNQLLPLSFGPKALLDRA